MPSHYLNILRPMLNVNPNNDVELITRLRIPALCITMALHEYHCVSNYPKIDSLFKNFFVLLENMTPKLRIIVPLWKESNGHGHIPLTKASNVMAIMILWSPQTSSVIIVVSHCQPHISDGRKYRNYPRNCPISYYIYYIYTLYVTM